MNDQLSAGFQPETIPTTLPILPLFDVVCFPKMVLPLVVMESESVLLIDNAMETNRIIGLISSKQEENFLLSQ